MITHRQAIIVLNGQLVSVDMKLATILLRLNFEGINTSASCQGGKVSGPTEGYIAFWGTKMTKKTRKRVQKILGIPGRLPTYMLAEDGYCSDDDPKLPYWEYWENRECGNWVIRFQRID